MIDARIIGRYIDEDGLIKHIWTGSGIEFDTSAPELAINVLAQYSKFEIWVAVELNGARILRTMLLPGMNRIPVYKNLNPDDMKRIRVIKDSQAYLDDDAHYMSIVEVTDLAGNRVTTTKTPDKRLSIEFIGDSLTSGEGLIGSISDMDFSYCYTCFEGNFAKLISDSLDADYSVVSQCGYGVVCGWNNDLKMNMSEVYKYSDGKSIPYAFDKQFDYIMINLGTNDNGASYQVPFDGFKITRDRFRQGVKEFLDYVMEKNPDSKIIWATGMCDIDFEEDIIAIIDALSSPRVSFVKLASADLLDHGSRNHPGPLTHKEAANRLIVEINK